MENLILILLLILFFTFIYLLMSRIDQILDRLRKGNLRMNSSGRTRIGQYLKRMILWIDFTDHSFYDKGKRRTFP